MWTDGLARKCLLFSFFFFPPKKGGVGGSSFDSIRRVQTSIRDWKGWAAFINKVNQELMLFPAQAVLSWNRSCSMGGEQGRCAEGKVTVIHPHVTKEGDVMNHVKRSISRKSRNRGERDGYFYQAQRKWEQIWIYWWCTPMIRQDAQAWAELDPLDSWNWEDIPGEAIKDLKVHLWPWLCAAN